MKHGRNIAHLAAGVLYGLAIGAAGAAPLNIANVPLFLPGALPPRVLVALSKDHEMFKLAYPDYSDLDGDGKIDSTYTDTFSYYGYFDSGKCYSYTGGLFVPEGSAGGANDHYCDNNLWSGNFLNWASMTRMDIVRRVLYGGYRSTDTDEQTVLQRELIPNSAHAFVKIYDGADLDRLTPYSGTISMCNVTWATTGLSHEVNVATNPPLLRVANGAWPTWAATEIHQCAWRSESTSGTSSARPVSGTGNHELGTFNVRVEVCRAGMLESNCDTYPAGSHKPTGLLQRYGDRGQIHFGLLTGSYEKNTSGGVLRRNIGPITGNTGAQAQENEIDPTTGIFANTAANNQNLINAINRLRITHWNYGTSRFVDGACNVPGISTITDNMCTNWGNPVGEMVLEALRYFAGESNPTSAFSTSDSARLPGLPAANAWRDPIPVEASCANPNLILLSSGVTTHDVGTAASYGSASGIPGLNVAARTNEVGAGEGISGSYILGGSPDNQCSAKSISGLADAQGVCPAGPSLLGGYNVAGLAYHAWTNDLRPEYGGRSRNVKTYAVNLAEPLPRLQFGNIELLPTCQSSSNNANDNGPWNTCNAVQTDVLSAKYDGSGNLVAGQFRTFWEDSTYGNDYDMDGAADLIVCRGAECGGGVAADQVRVTVDVVQAYAGFRLRFGFLASGSTTDGLSAWVTRPGGGGQNFSVIVSPQDNPGARPTPQSTLLTPGTSSATLLRDPLWYAAKWGGFNKELGSTPAPDLDPDNYYLVRNPARLEADLEQVFTNIITGNSSASAVATNSTRLDTNTLIYQARFRSDDWTGQLLAYELLPNGSLGTVQWDAADLIPAPDSRKIYTRNGTTPGAAGGVEFKWADLGTAHQTALNQHPADGTTDSAGEARVLWLRGDPTQGGGLFRNRSAVLGDIINSDPQFVGALNFGYGALPVGTPGRTTYAAFRNSKVSSTTGAPLEPMMYVGANDGMLHAFDATAGTEHFAYVPSTLIPELNQLTDPAYTHRYFVDGQIAVGDVHINRGGIEQWATVLVGTTGAGGRTVFALDVTRPHAFGSNDVLWEFTHPDLGNTIGQPVVARMADGTWAAIFGNGYNSDSQTAKLFIVRIADGTLLTPPIDTGVGSIAEPNGLATPSLLADGTRTIRTIYGGDLAGNLWKFDVSDTNPANWGVAFAASGEPAPLFKATDVDGVAQAITAPVEIGRHPDGGYMIYFGTGKFFETNDNIVGAAPQVHSFYGIWDKPTPSAITYAPGVREAVLTRQEIQYEGQPSGSNFNIRVTTQNTVNYATSRGWYIDLESPTLGAQGERVVSLPILRNNRVIFPTLVPSPNPCEFGGGSWLMELNAVNGARLEQPPLDITEDGDIDSNDLVTVNIGGSWVTVAPSAVESREGIIDTPAVVEDPTTGEEIKIASGTSGEVEVLRESGSGGRARGSWRQLR